MNTLKDLIWEDITSPTMDPQEYMKKSSEKKEVLEYYENYSPDKDSIKKIKEYLLKNQESIKLLAIGAVWCPDCFRNIPRMIKILEEFEDIEFKILYGVKVDAYKKKNKDSIAWNAKKSPKEAVDPKFDLLKIPIIYIFNKEGKYINRIVENPREGSTLEEDIAYYLNAQKNL